MFFKFLKLNSRDLLDSSALCMAVTLLFLPIQLLIPLLSPEDVPMLYEVLLPGGCILMTLVLSTSTISGYLDIPLSMGLSRKTSLKLLLGYLACMTLFHLTITGLLALLLRAVLPSLMLTLSGCTAITTDLTVPAGEGLLVLNYPPSLCCFQWWFTLPAAVLGVILGTLCRRFSWAYMLPLLAMPAVGLLQDYIDAAPVLCGTLSVLFLAAGLLLSLRALLRTPVRR